MGLATDHSCDWEADVQTMKQITNECAVRSVQSGFVLVSTVLDKQDWNG